MSHGRDHQSEGDSQTTAPSTPSAWRPFSVTDTPTHHLTGSSYFTPSSPSTSRRGMPRSVSGASTQHRSTSVASRASRTQQDDEDDEDSDEVAAQPADDENVEDEEEEEDPFTLKARQSLINVEHPFGLRIWKPALYKKSRSVTRHADAALHNVPSAQAERHIVPGNIFWVVFFGWWLSSVCMLVSLILYFLPDGGKQFYRLTYGLGWYIVWPFGKYVEGEGIAHDQDPPETADAHARANSANSDTSAAETIRGTDTVRGQHHVQSVSWNSNPANETTSLLRPVSEADIPAPSRSYGATSIPDTGLKGVPSPRTLGHLAYWFFFTCIIAPLMLFVCLICWGLVLTIPMAKLNWALVKHLWDHPEAIRFCSAPKALVIAAEDEEAAPQHHPNVGDGSASAPSTFSVKQMRLSAGQAAPGPSPSSTVLLCTYHAAGMQYYKYTVGGVNIMFVNLMAVVIFVVFDGFVLMRLLEHKEEHNQHVSPFLAFIASKGLIFVMSLLSVIPLSYFIGMAVASISAQSSIGMGAVINATFGSLIEIILYAMMLDDSKGRLVEGSIVGSLMAGVLLMPGLSMVSSALKRKEQKFNAKSAGVTSMMLIMAVIGTLAPTLFYQTYGNFRLICTGCPSKTPTSPDQPWICDQCYYEHPDPVSDPFYQSTVKSLMYFCAWVLIFSYLIGLWFSLRTHATQIWQNPQQIMHHANDQFAAPGSAGGLNRPVSLYHKISHSIKTPTLHRRSSNAGSSNVGTEREPSSADHRAPGSSLQQQQIPSIRTSSPSSPLLNRRISFSQNLPIHTAQNLPLQTPTPYTPVMESVDAVVKRQQQEMRLPANMTTDDFTRAVAVATVSALRHQQANTLQKPGRASGGAVVAVTDDAGGHGGHDAPNWGRTTSASVLLVCTALYAVIAELLVDCVDVILGDSGADEKFLGITLFALVPNTTEFMNAISFALHGNIALSMEIGSAYALQVCLLQIPALIAFSAFYRPDEMGKVARTFTLIFPRWDVIVLILSMFLMTYTYIEAKSNYHRGSILILSYLVMVSGFFFAPGANDKDDIAGADGAGDIGVTSQAKAFSMTLWGMARYHLTTLWR